MNIQPLSTAVKSLVFPGSAIIAGKSPDGQSAITAFFICGINAHERDRVFTADASGVSIVPFSDVSGSGIRCVTDNDTRISVMSSGVQAEIEFSGDTIELCMSISKQYNRTGVKHTFEYSNPEDGICYILPALSGSAFPFGAFEGEPIPVSLTGSIFDVVADIWENLRPETRVSLWVKSTDLTTHKSISRIINRNR